MTPRDLHLIVAHLLRVRFPIVLACNKMDQAAAPQHLAALRKAYPTGTYSILFFSLSLSCARHIQQAPTLCAVYSIIVKYIWYIQYI